MERCSRCGSFAINHHSHGRDGTDPDLCDVCYWRKRAEFGGPIVTQPLTADGMKEPKNGEHWRVEWWNESCRMMLPTHLKLDSFQSYKNGTLMFTIKKENGNG